MAVEIKLIKVYHTKKSRDLRAKIKVNKKVYSVKCGQSFPPKRRIEGFPEFEITGISKDDLGEELTIRTVPAQEKIRLTPTESHFI